MAKISGKYETIFIVNPKLEEAAATAVVDKFKSLVEANGTNVEVEDWGKRRLAYPIEDQTEGVYTLVRFESKPDFPAELDRNYKITDGIMRSIIVFSILHRIPEGSIATSNQADNQCGRHPERRRDFGSIQNPQPPAGSGSQIKDPSALLHAGNDLQNQFFYFGDCLSDSQRHFLIFRIDIFKQVPDGLPFQVVIERILFRYLNE